MQSSIHSGTFPLLYRVVSNHENKKYGAICIELLNVILKPRLLFKKMASPNFWGVKNGVNHYRCLIYTIYCGERGIRTPGTSRYGGFQDRCNRPLYHLSK